MYFFFFSYFLFFLTHGCAALRLLATMTTTGDKQTNLGRRGTTPAAKTATQH